MTSRSAQRSLLGEDVARAEFGGAGKCQVFAHAVGIEGRNMPRAFEEAMLLEGPRRNARQLVVPRQILGDRAGKGIESSIAGACWSIGQAGLSGFRVGSQIERIKKFREHLLLRFSRKNPIKRLGEGSWAHQFYLRATRYV